MSDGQSPYRDDGRTQRHAPCAPVEIATKIALRQQRPWTAYLAWVGVVASSTAMAVADPPWPGLLFGLVLALLAVASARRKLTVVADALPSGCAFTPEGLVLEGIHGTSHWHYDAVTEVTRDGPWLLLVLRGGLFLVLHADAPGEPPLEAWLTARLPRLARARSEIRLLALGVAYASLAAAAVLLRR
jgi:hypothetical protein